MEILIIAILIGFIPAAIASSKGRNFVAWWLYGAALFIVALPHALLMKADEKALEGEKLASGTNRKCPFCAEIIKAEARVCRFCGRDLPAIEAATSPAEQHRQFSQAVYERAKIEKTPEVQGTENKTRNHDRTFIMVILGGIIVLVIVAAVFQSPSEVDKSYGSAANPVVPGVSPAATDGGNTGNTAHDRMLHLDPDARAAALGLAAGDGCRGTDSFFMGMNSKDNSAYWSVRCTNGKSYQVSIDANATGSTSVMDCDLLKTVAKISCFAKLDQQ
jgi:hypothetical protein